ncbi:hypothetical protein NDA11_005757 [Ustilago hordei]|nr:hypothetical protein NDA11_005757 [Ustilago hordei]
MLDNKACSDPSGKQPFGLRIGIIGGGMSGICMACKLLEALPGSEVTLFELNDQLGGTWYTHRYPGVACDSPSHLYSFWFSPNPGFKSKFASGNENLTYLQAVARKHDLDRFVRYRTEVKAAQWDAKKMVWHTTVRDLAEPVGAEPKEYDFDVLISCAGGQRNPIKPSNIVDHFAGPVYHSSEYPRDLDLASKRVAVVGTGSSSIQIVPALTTFPESQRPSEIHVFQKSPGWVLKLPRGRFSSTVCKAFELLPWLLWLYRAVLLIYYDIFIHWLLRKEDMMRSYALSALTTQINTDSVLENAASEKCSESESGSSEDTICMGKDGKGDIDIAKLVESLSPEWSVGCRRVMVSDTFYPALLKKDVFFHPSQVKCVSSLDKRTLITSQGNGVQVDAVILATGYNYHGWIRPLQITNDVGEELVDVWQTSEVRGRYFGLATSGFPNLFHLFGPASRPGQGALSTIAELQAGEIICCITELGKLPLKSCICVSIEAENRMARTIHEGIVDSPFAQNCGGWYKNRKGFPSTLWPFTAFRFYRLLRSFDRKQTWLVSSPSTCT